MYTVCDSTCVCVCVCVYIELESQRKQAELDKRAYEDIVKERDILSKVGHHIIPSPLYNILHSAHTGPEEVRGEQ